MASPAAATTTVMVCQVVISKVTRRRKERYPEDEVWTSPKEPNSPNQQEAAYRGLHPSPSNPLSLLPSVGGLEGIRVEKGGRKGNL